jgi:hypothetical protein
VTVVEPQRTTAVGYVAFPSGRLLRSSGGEESDQQYVAQALHTCSASGRTAHGDQAGLLRLLPSAPDDAAIRAPEHLRGRSGSGRGPELRVVDLWMVGQRVIIDDNVAFVPSLRWRSDQPLPACGDATSRRAPRRTARPRRSSVCCGRCNRVPGSFWFMERGEVVDNVSKHAYPDDGLWSSSNSARPAPVSTTSGHGVRRQAPT